MTSEPVDKYDGEQIRAFWSEQAKQHRGSPCASWSDVTMIEKEICEIVARLDDDDRVLDVGCANGYSTVRFAAQKRIVIRGIDYIPEMIAEARRRLGNLPSPLLGEVEFDVGDITSLEEPDEAYDKVIIIRVIINLESWERQLAGMREAVRVLKPGGTLLLSEATLQGWKRLNAFRHEWRLPDIAMPPFNLYLDQEKVVSALSPDLELVELVDFSSTYYIGTRLLKPLVINALRLDIDVANPDMHWNRFFGSLPSAGDYGVQRLFAFKKR